MIVSEQRRKKQRTARRRRYDRLPVFICEALNPDNVGREGARARERRAYVVTDISAPIDQGLNVVGSRPADSVSPDSNSII